MPPEAVRRIGGAQRQVVVESGLLAQRRTCPDPAGLFALGLPDLARRRQHLLGALGGDEQHAVVAHQVRPEPRSGQRLGLALVQPHRAERIAAVAEHRKADLRQLRRVAVQPPHHQARHPCRLGLQDRQVADTRLVAPPAVVDDHHVTRFGPAAYPSSTRHLAPQQSASPRTPVVPDERAVPGHFTNRRSVMAVRSTGYRRRWGKWLAISTAAAVVAYLIVYFVFFYHSGGGGGGGLY